MKEKRGAIYGIGIALVLFGLVSISVLPPAATAWYRDEGGSDEATISATADSYVDIQNENFVLKTSFDAGGHNDGCACFAGQGVCMADSGDYIDHVVTMTSYREQENIYTYYLDYNYHYGYETRYNNGYHTREDLFKYRMVQVNGVVNKGELSCNYTYYSPIT